MMEMLGKGFLLGLATGPACLMACFPVLLPVVIGGIGDKPVTGRGVYSWRIMAHFLGGRASAYILLGMLIGFVGGQMGGKGYAIAVCASFLMSLLMISYGLGARIGHLRTCHYIARFGGKAQVPFVLGLLTGLNVCPPFLLAMSICLSGGHSLVTGGVFFLAFFVASSLYMLPAGAGRIFSWFGQKAANTGRIAAIFVGLFFLAHSSMNLWRLING